MKKKKAATRKPEGAPRWVAVAGALVAIAGLAWAIVSFFLRAEPTAKPTTTEQKAEAIDGTAINAAGAAEVSIGSESSAPFAKSPSVSDHSTHQSAKAGSGGTAINATGSSEVNVKGR